MPLRRLKSEILAKVTGGVMRAIYPPDSMTPLAGAATRRCLACDEPISTSRVGAVEYRLPDGTRHAYHLRCDSVRLIVAADLLRRQIPQRELLQSDGKP